MTRRWRFFRALFRSDQGDPQIDDLIAAKGAVVRFAGHDDSLRIRAEGRRAHAADKRRAAAQIESGQPIEERLRLVR